MRINFKPCMATHLVKGVFVSCLIAPCALAQTATQWDRMTRSLSSLVHDADLIQEAYISSSELMACKKEGYSLVYRYHARISKTRTIDFCSDQELTVNRIYVLFFEGRDSDGLRWLPYDAVYEEQSGSQFYRVPAYRGITDKTAEGEILLRGVLEPDFTKKVKFQAMGEESP